MSTLRRISQKQNTNTVPRYAATEQRNRAFRILNKITPICDQTGKTIAVQSREKEKAKKK